jgi:hypothetical protein
MGLVIQFRWYTSLMKPASNNLALSLSLSLSLYYILLVLGKTAELLLDGLGLRV